MPYVRSQSTIQQLESVHNVHQRYQQLQIQVYIVSVLRASLLLLMHYQLTIPRLHHTHRKPKITHTTSPKLYSRNTSGSDNTISVIKDYYNETTHDVICHPKFTRTTSISAHKKMPLLMVLVQ